MESRFVCKKLEQEISLSGKNLHQKSLVIPRHLQTQSWVVNGQRIWVKYVT